MAMNYGTDWISPVSRGLPMDWIDRCLRDPGLLKKDGIGYATSEGNT